MTYQIKQSNAYRECLMPASSWHGNRVCDHNLFSNFSMKSRLTNISTTFRNRLILTDAPVYWTWPDTFQEGSVVEPSWSASNKSLGWFVPSGAFFWPTGMLFYNLVFDILFLSFRFSIVWCKAQTVGRGKNNNELARVLLACLVLTITTATVAVVA